MPVNRSKIKKIAFTHKRKILFPAIVITIIALLGLAVVYWSAIKKGFIRQKVKTTVSEKSDRLYFIHYKDMELDEVNGYLSVSDLSLRYDSSKYATLQGEDIPSTLFTVSIPAIKVTGVETPKALIAKQIVGQKLEITNPVIDIIYTHKGKNAGKSIPATEVYKQILGELEMIRMDTFLITGAKITIRDLPSDKPKLLITDTYIQLRDLSLDSAANRDSTRLLFSKHINVDCKSLSWLSKDGLYTYRADSVSCDMDNSSARAGAFRVIPMLDERSFAAKKKVQADRYDITLNKIEIAGLNFYHLFDEKVEADKISIYQPVIKIYRDMTRPHDHKSRIGTYPQQRIAQIPVPVDVKTLELKDSYVEYKEKSRLLAKTGKVRFHHLNGFFSNITNMSGKGNVLTAKVNARFLNIYPVKTYWAFYLHSKRGRFDVSGHMGQGKAAAVSSVTVPLGGVRIDKGMIRSLDFDFRADNYSMGGKVKILYDDLKVSMLKKDEKEKVMEKKKLASIGANLLVKNNNPSGNKPPRTGDAYFERDTTRSMFHMAWKTLMDGIGKSVLITHQ
jgi:hypothetical protein